MVGGRGLVNGDALTGALATAATTASGVGAYAITQGTLAASANYAVTYRGADLTVTPRPITVTADAQSRTYGDANPALTYVVGGRGLVNGDALTGALATVATTASGVGAYAITRGTLAASANYAVTYRGADLTVTALDAGKTAGASDPDLTSTILSGGLVGGDAFSGTLSRQPGEAAGILPIEQSALPLGPNYVVTFIGGRFTITSAPIGPAIAPPLQPIFVPWPTDPRAPTPLFTTDVLDGLLNRSPWLGSGGRPFLVSSQPRGGSGASCYLDGRNVLICEAIP